MSQHLLPISIILVALMGVTIGGRHGGHGGPPRGGTPHGGPPHGGGPLEVAPFLRNVTTEGRKEFDSVLRNESLTIAEMETKLTALAEKYGVTAEYTEFEANRTARLTEIRKNVTDVIGNLSTVFSSISTIYENKNQTRQGQREAVEALRVQYPNEVDTIQFIREHVGGGRHGGHGPRGGPPRGGPRGGHGGPRGGPRGFRPRGSHERQESA
uniref:DUF148 domain-containing protein n=2 Tax=Caenorhabditis tropicalis TaxID=1561998 RepID=A0A1I7UYF5_9PELO